MKICKFSQLSESEPVRVDVGDKYIMIVRVGGNVLATDSLCTHEEADLSLGILSDVVITCPLHGAKFDLRTGEVQEGPSGTDRTNIPNLRIYKVEIENDELLVDI